MTGLVARDTLAASRLFAAQADRANDDVTSFRYNLEAAIVFARSVTFHIQKELNHRPGFEEWYATWQKRLGNDVLCAYFLETRNFILKQGRVGLRQDVTVSIHEGLQVRGELGVTVIRGTPWYRRSPAVLWDDLSWPLRNRWVPRRQQARATRASASAETGPRVSAETRRCFVDFRPTEPALDVFSEYLRILEDLILDAEKRYS